MPGLSLAARFLLFYGTAVPNHPGKWRIHERLRHIFGISVNGYHEVKRDGLRWLLNPNDFTDSALFWMGMRNTWDIFHLRRLLRPGAVIVDVGANFGHCALNLAYALDKQCQIFALEPDPANFERLYRHIEWNGCDATIETFNVGVSDHEEVVRISRPSENSGHSHIDPAGNVEDVSLTTLDSFCDDHGIKHLDLLILDVEGYEERALLGAEFVLTHLRPTVFVELFPPVMERQGSSAKAVVDLLSNAGYTLWLARRDHLVPLEEVPRDDFGVNVFGFHNTITDCSKHFQGGR